MNYHIFAQKIKQWGQQLGFCQVAIANTELSQAEYYLQQWLAKGWHGEMAYMQKHGSKRSHPQQIMASTVSIICVKIDYLSIDAQQSWQLLAQPKQAYISRYALGRDYHKVLKQKLKQFALKIQQYADSFDYRLFVDTAPVLEKALAEKAGLGWIGKHTNLIHRQQGSWFFLGEIYTNLPLPYDPPVTPHCGRCSACIDICPTQAIIAPYQLDARLCISYLTIEYHGIIPLTLRSKIGNRIYGCDDCQLICPWNRFAQLSQEPDFQSRHGLESTDLVTLFLWDESTFLQKTEGSAIRRIGYQRWLRNIAVALGNAQSSPEIIQALQQQYPKTSALVQQHITWALQQHKKF